MSMHLHPGEAWSHATMIVAGPPQIDHDRDTELVVACPTRSERLL
ncbi:hypothetical protein [Micromonospora sp. 067-2]